MVRVIVGSSSLRSLAWGNVVGPLIVGLFLGACSERERLTFESPNDGVGPLATIERPGQDTAVSAGPGFMVVGQVSDSDGVDSVYFDITGGVTAFPPLNSDQDTVHFSLPITTSGQAGRSILVEVYGVDDAGNRGERAGRRLDVR